MNTFGQRQQLVDKLEFLKTNGAKEKDSEIRWIRSQIGLLDRVLLQEEVERLRKSRLSFTGETLEQQLGCDRWLLS